jgi:hypothetical protein
VIERNIFVAVEPKTLILTEGKSNRFGIALLRQCSADKNLYFNTADPEWGARHFAAQRKYGVEMNSIAADPMFVNPTEGDFRLKEGSPALKLGFEPIDQTRMGVSKNSNN